VAVFLQQEFRPWVLVKNYTLTHALFHPSDLIIQPSWSLTVEECFYLLAPLFMLLTRRLGFFAALMMGAALLAAALAISGLPTEFLHTRTFVLDTTFFGHFVEFFAGVYLALAVLRLETRGPIALPGNRWTLAGVAGVLLVVIAMMITYGHPHPLHVGVIILLNNFLIPVPIAVLYWGLLRERTWLSRMLSGPLAGLLGRSSYSFYLLHTLIIHYVSIPLLPLLGSRLACVLLTFIITWLASVLLFLYFEEPVNLRIRRRFRSKEKWVGVQATLFKGT